MFSPFFAKVFKRVVARGDGRAVQTRTGHCAVHVDQFHDARGQRNLRAFEFIGIPRAVETFMMMPDDRRERLQPGDLVITGDVPLAAEVVRRGGTGLNPRGTLYTAENIHDHLARRDLFEQLRETGAITSSMSAPGKRELQDFANQLDRYLTAARGRP